MTPERLTSITNNAYVPAVMDGVFNSNVFMARVFTRDPKQWDGSTLYIPIAVAKNDANGSFTGVGNFDTGLKDTRRKQAFLPKAFYQGVTVGGFEASINRTKAGVLKLLSVTMQEAQTAMTDAIGDLLYGVGAGNDFQGLGAIVDNGTNTTTYGDLSRTTYPLLNSTVLAASGGALSLAYIASLFRGAAAAGSKKEAPTMLLSDETTWDLYETFLTPTVSANYDAGSRAVITAFSKPGTTLQGGASLEGVAGFETLKWRGRPFIADEKADSQTLFLLNENHLDWHSLPAADCQSYSYKDGGLQGVQTEYEKTFPLYFTGLSKPDAQYAQVGQFLMLGNLISGSTRRHAKGTGITTA